MKRPPSRFALKALQAIFRLEDKFRRDTVAEVPLDRIRIGQVAGIRRYAWAELTGDLADLACPIAASPHLEALLGDYSRYVRMASGVAAAAGHFHGMKDPADVVNSLHRFRQARGKVLPPVPDSELPVLAEFGSSGWYEILDGHHRLALAAYHDPQGLEAVRVRVRGSVPSWWATKLRRVAMTKGRRELYQPLPEEVGEVASWPLVRTCSERVDMILQDLRHRVNGPLGRGPINTALDLGCSTGYFTQALANARLTALGVDSDPRALQIAEAAWKAPAGFLGFYRANIEAYLQDKAAPMPEADVVLFLSCLHHWGLGMNNGLTVAEVLGLLGAKTRRVLYLDSGQEHESWFRGRLPGWNPETLARWVCKYGGFGSYQVLGADEDGAAGTPYAGNYGRTLFAFVKE